MTKKNRIVSLILCTILLASAGNMSVMESYAAERPLNITQAKTMAMADNSSYRKLKNKLILTQVKYQEAVKSIRLKKKNMSTFRWTPLLSFKFPESPNLAEEFEFTYKPIQIQSEITAIQHEMSVVKYDVYEEVGNKFTEVYTLQETIAFYEEQLENSKTNLKRNQARFLVGEANKNDIETMEKSISSLESKLVGKMREFEKAKKKLSEMIHLDVASGYRFQNPYMETSMKRSNLENIQQNTLDKDQAYYEVKLNTQLQRISLDTNYSLMRNQYGRKMNRLDSFIRTVKDGGKVDSDALKEQYDVMLEDVDAPWQGHKRILFIKFPKEWFKGQISGVRYVEDEPYVLYTNILEYQDALAEEESAKKELLETVEDSYDNVITTKNAYETMKKETDALKKDVDAAMLLNKAGDLSYEELADLQAAYEENQAVLLETLSTYTQALYSLDGLSCGAITSMMYAAGTNMSAVSGGDSIVVEEIAEGARYYIRTAVEDNIFEVGISIPDDYTLEVTSFELWIDGVQVGQRTDFDKVIRHLALDKEDAEKVIIRLYAGEEFVADCEIDPQEYEGPLEAVEQYKPVEEEDTVVAEYQSGIGMNGIIEITITPITEDEKPSYYTIENKEGKRLYGEKPISVEESFYHLSLLSEDLGELRVRFYDSSENEMYIAEFDTASLQLRRIQE